MKDKISKFINVTKRDGIIKTIKRTITYITANYINRINIRKRIKFKIQKEKLSHEIDSILERKYKRILIWRGSFGWNVPLFQRPQQIANCLSEKNCLILYEVTRMTDKIDFIKKEKNNLYLIDYEISKFEKLLFEKLKQINKPKYLQLYSTCWDVKKEEVDMYVNNGFNMLYEYIDDLNPILAGTQELPKNVKDIHNYVISNQDVLVVTSADLLYEDMVKKRGSSNNIILSSNGVDIDHFSKFTNMKIEKMEQLKQNYEMIIGYYGALASWIDYELIKKLANHYKNIAFVFIGIKYDNSLSLSKIEDIENIKFMGKVEYNILPEYAKYFDIAWIPFIINEITLATNPIKVFEYMALKKYIITSALPECKKYKSINIANNYEEFCYLIDNYNNKYNDDYCKLLEKEAKENSWKYKADEIINLLEKFENHK